MSFANPLFLAVLFGLPVLWWLLRAVPPPPRRQIFPAIRLLHGLHSDDSTVQRTPWWLLLLRTIIVTLTVAGFAGPIWRAVSPAPHTGPLRLVIDDGWASAPDWPIRMRAAGVALDQAARESIPVSLMTTADDENGAPPQPTAFMQADALRPIVTALRPKPYSTDRAAAATILTRQPPHATWSIYIADGIATPGDSAFTAALSASGPVNEERASPGALQLLTGSGTQGSALTAEVGLLPVDAPRSVSLLAQTATMGSLAHATAIVPPHAVRASLSVTLPADIRNRLSQFALETPLDASIQPPPGPGAGSIFLLDDSAHLHPVGLVAVDQAADLPLTGGLFYIKQALQPGAELHEGDLSQLLARKLAVIIDTNPRLDDADAEKLRHWIAQGGWLIRFSGFDMAEDDRLVPVPLSHGNRQLGGALTWEQPAHLAPFPADSPFSGLTAPTDVTISRQVMAQPTPGLSAHSWADLTDGTPLVTWTSIGQGKLVLFHVTASPAWSSLPFSGVFPQMLKRLVASSGGVGATGEQPHGHDLLAPIETLNGFGILGPPPVSATAIPADRISTTSVSVHHPPGFYGSADFRVALNIGNHDTSLTSEARIGTIENLDRIAADRDLTSLFLTASLILLLIDWLIGLHLRGILLTGLVVFTLCAPHAGQAQGTVPDAALHLRLAYVSAGNGTDDPQIAEGLKNLSAYVNAHTAVRLADPQPVTPGVDDLSFYPLLYWPVSANAPLSARGIAALNRYMALGGLLVIDTQTDGGGDQSGERALRRVEGLNAPPLMPLTPQHVLTRAFYLIDSCGGRSNGTVWIARPTEAGGDQVSPIIIGGNGWASAWAAGGATMLQNSGPSFGYDQTPGQTYAQTYAPTYGQSPYDADPQAKLAFHCGTNLVIYALTGTYKADQQHVQKLLDGLGH